MGFVTESEMRTDYTLIFYESITDTEHMVAYLTPNGILIEIVKEGMDSHSVDEWVTFDKLIEIRDDGVIEKIKNELKDKRRQHDNK